MFVTAFINEETREKKVLLIRTERKFNPSRYEIKLLSHYYVSAEL